MIRRSGYILDGLVAKEFRLQTLFESDDERCHRLVTAIDAINDKQGRWTIVSAVQGFRRE